VLTLCSPDGPGRSQEKRQRADALQDLAEHLTHPMLAVASGVRLSSAVFARYGMEVAPCAKNIEMTFRPLYGGSMSRTLLRLSVASIVLTFCLLLQAAENSYTIAVIPKGTTHEFWKSINAGAKKAEQELRAQGTKIAIIWKGPLREDDRDQQIQVVENFMTRHVSSMVLAPLDDRALVKPVENAMKAGVPVVIMDSDLKTDKYVSFVATDNYKGGQLAGEEMGRQLGGKGNVILLRYAVGSASTEAREAGFLDALKKYPNIKLISSDQHAGATRELAYQVSQNLLNRFKHEVNGIFCPCEPPTIAMTKALRELGLAGGKVKMIGFDSGSQSVTDMKNGDVQALVVQNPLLMGYLGVITAVKNLRGEKVERRIDTGVALITRENMDQPEMKELLAPPIEKYLK
jgi:ribose transport system substrate-binding protein